MDTSRRRWGSWAAGGRRGWRRGSWWRGCSPGGTRSSTRCCPAASPASSGSSASTASACTPPRSPRRRHLNIQRFSDGSESEIVKRQSKISTNLYMVI
ncbi:Os11g0671100 [Oryza sativa Japonica Group]|uniref:Os11g0671100 protein n=2 Tax=Oryza sativa subsp. japonica TaxID=39947 RepID=Q0IR71_ORYSJ|nr:Os11g0671100 [Oryza sativa Japonica Group]BAT15195.1 Os11g0671100 [Oryza sativa Japonica Group]|eukprot:NP_001068431.1 Os11g0671100 [Oryza sativa Japonica Group]